MAAQRKSNILAVLVTAYLCALWIEWVDLRPSLHFWLYSALSLAMIVYCHDKCRILKGYAIVNFAMLCAYSPLITADCPLISLILWDANLSLSDIMLSYELAMLIYGGWCAAMAIYNRFVDVDSGSGAGHSHNNQGTKA